MILRVLAGLFLAASLTIAQEGMPSVVTFRVTDDAGGVVANVLVEGCFLDLSQSGARTPFNGFTDTNGIFVAQGETLLGVYAHFSRDGHYLTTVKQTIEYKRKADGKGYERIDRWDRDISVILKRIRNQIPMLIEDVENRHISAFEGVGKYRLAGAANFDMVRGAFLPPDGNGEVADIGFKWKMTIHTTNQVGRAIEYDTLCDILLSNIVDGICLGEPDGAENGQLGSAYISSYEAPISGYTNAISFYYNFRGKERSETVESNDDNNYLYYFRIRTQTNAMGQITNALYGQIHGQINGRFTYYLNPAPNDRNVEFDPKKNLFKNLSSLEEVSAP